MTQKRYRVRSGVIDEWVNAEGYVAALVKALKGMDQNVLHGTAATVLMEGDDERFTVTYDVGKYISPVQLSEADFSDKDFTWFESTKSYYVCEKAAFTLEVEQIDNEDWRYRVSRSSREVSLEGETSSKMIAVGRCEGYCLGVLAAQQ